MKIMSIQASRTNNKNSYFSTNNNAQIGLKPMPMDSVTFGKNPVTDVTKALRHFFKENGIMLVEEQANGTNVAHLTNVTRLIDVTIPTQGKHKPTPFKFSESSDVSKDYALRDLYKRLIKQGITEVVEWTKLDLKSDLSTSDLPTSDLPNIESFKNYLEQKKIEVSQEGPLFRIPLLRTPDRHFTGPCAQAIGRNLDQALETLLPQLIEGECYVGSVVKIPTKKELLDMKIPE